MIAPETRGQFYDNNPNMLGQPMVCPKCKKGRLANGMKCPVKGCFYVQANQMPDGRPICPVCKKLFP